MENRLPTAFTIFVRPNAEVKECWEHPWGRVRGEGCKWKFPWFGVYLTPCLDEYLNGRCPSIKRRRAGICHRRSEDIPPIFCRSVKVCAASKKLCHHLRHPTTVMQRRLTPYVFEING